MAVPNFQSFFIPVLKVLSDESVKKRGEIFTLVANYCELTQDDREEKLSSGWIVYQNRVQWACVYLKQAAILEQPSKGYYKVTARGLKVLQEDLENINLKYLMQFTEFQEFRNRAHKPKKDRADQELESSVDKTPDELIAEGVEEINQKVKFELLERLRAHDFYKFEGIVGNLLAAMGYGNYIPTKKSGDGGIDGILDQDALGLDRIIFQAKRFAENNTVPAKEIRDFLGTVDGNRVKKGIFVTTSNFTKDSTTLVSNSSNTIVLIDGEKLADLMLQYEIGVETAKLYKVWKVDNDFSDDD